MELDETINRLRDFSFSLNDPYLYEKNKEEVVRAIRKTLTSFIEALNSDTIEEELLISFGEVLFAVTENNGSRELLDSYEKWVERHNLSSTLKPFIEESKNLLSLYNL